MGTKKSVLRGKNKQATESLIRKKGNRGLKSSPKKVGPQFSHTTSSGNSSIVNKKESGKLPRQVKLVPINTNNRAELNWLHRFILTNYNVPHFILPTRDDLKHRSRRFFKAIVNSPTAQNPEVVGISGYEIRTPHLVETQKTIIAREFRGGGWGTAVSLAIEKEVANSGFHKARSCIYADNFAMIQIKLAQGYTIEGFHRDHDGPGLHEYSLGKILRPGQRSAQKPPRKPSRKPT